MTTSAVSKIKPGLQFRFVVADGNPLWQVKQLKRPGVWTCVGVDEPIIDNGKTFSSDFAGQVKDFIVEDILRALRFDDFWKQQHQKHVDYYDTLRLGQIVHYDNGFRNYIRCTVVLNDVGKKALQPIAMVGAWRQYDLPHYSRGGEIIYGHYPEMIKDKKTFTPNEGSIYESPSFHNKGGLNPGADKALSLEPPPMTKDQQADAILWAAIDSCHKIIEEGEKPFEIVIKTLSILKDGIDNFMKAKNAG
jgi:hypothetical protein